MEIKTHELTQPTINQIQTPNFKNQQLKVGHTFTKNKVINILTNNYLSWSSRDSSEKVRGINNFHTMTYVIHETIFATEI